MHPLYWFLLIFYGIPYLVFFLFMMRQKQHVQQARKNLYKIQKDGRVVGYLLASMHNFMTADVQQPFMAQLDELLKEIKAIYFEVKMPLSMLLHGFGTERFLLEYLEKQPQIAGHSLESYEYQMVMIDSILGIGSRLYPLPWHGLVRNFPSLCRLLNFWFKCAFVPINLVLSILNSSASLKKHLDTQSFNDKFRHEYLKGNLAAIPDETLNAYRVKERDRLMMRKMLDGDIFGEPILICVGAAHVAVEGGLYDLLVEHGFHFIEQPVVLE